ncbi:MAG: hypothetical protein Tsb0027_25080 [Wenzhouxiangellaceae bacterium]
MPHEQLVDERYGVVTALVSEPRQDDQLIRLHTRLAHVTDSQLLGQWQGDRIAYGASFDDPLPAAHAAIGEAVERYCGNFIPAAKLRQVSYQNLIAAGESAIAPSDWILYAPEQYHEPGFPFVPMTDDLVMNWVCAHSLTDNASAWVPAALVYINYFTGRLRNQPHTNFVIYSGIAAGPDLASAQRSALDELIERDATMIWWHSGSPAIAIDASTIPGWSELIETRKPVPELEFIPVWLPNLMQAPVLGVTAVDHRLGTISFGAACRAEPMAALKKALIEAAQLRGYARGLLDPEGGVWTAMSAGMLDASVYKPWREDRRYVQSYRSDYRDLTDLGCHSQFYLDPDAHYHAQRLTAPEQSCHFADIKAMPEVGRSDPAAHISLLARHGFQAWCVDVTTPDVALAGLSVVRVLVPGLYPNAPAAFPFLGGKRLYEEPCAQGWLGHSLKFDDLEFAPLPHS